MYKQKRGSARKRGRGLGLCLAVLLCLGSFPQLQGAGTAHAASTDDYIGTNNLVDVFNWQNTTNFSPSTHGIFGNRYFLVDTSSYTPYPGVATLNYASSSLVSKVEISLEADWELSGTFDISIHAPLPVLSNAAICLTQDANNTQRFIYLSVGKANDILGLLINRADYSLPVINDYVDRKDLPSTYFSGSRPFSVRYSCSEKKLYFTYGSYTLSSRVDDFYPGVEKLYLLITGEVTWEKTAAVPTGSKAGGTFTTAAYTSYYPEFVETKLLKANGSAFATGEIPKNGDTVIVQAKVKNINKKASSQAIPCTLKLLQGNKDYPTAGIVPLTKAQGQQIVANGQTVDGGTDIVGSGIPFKMTGAGDNTITYKAKIVNPTGAAVTVGQTIADDFFQSHRYSKAELVPAIPLVPEDPDATPDPSQPQPVPGTDYHYTRTPANENGWNNSQVDLVFYEGTFDQFHIKKGNAVEATLQRGDAVKSYTAETSGIPLTYQAVNTANGKLSSTVNDTVKIDGTPPTLTASGNTLTAVDSLSGVWKLERQDPITGTWSAAKTFSLSSSGNGSASQTFTPTQNGVYRAVDAAGNPSAASIPITVNDPPEIEVKDEPNHHNPQGPTASADEAGLVHAVYTDTIEEIISDPPAYGGALTGSDLQSIIEGRYQFTSHSGALSGQLVSTTQSGADISATGLDSSTPGSCQAVYRITDQDGNTATLNLTYSFIDKPLPPTVEPNEPDNPLVGPEETVGPQENRVHHRYTAQVVELISDPPAYGGTFTAADALAYIKGHYTFAAQTGSTLGESSTMTQNGVDISATGLDSSIPGSCLITYTVADGDGNTATLELTYTFRERVEPPAIDPVDPDTPMPEPEEEVDKSGLVHQTYREQIVQIITDPPAFGGTLTADDLKAVIEGRYAFGAGTVTYAMTQNGADISAAGLPSTVPGSCLGRYTVTDGDGNSTTLELTYTFIEKSEPPAILPDDPDRPPQGPEETVAPDNTVHHRYTDTVVELISDPPAYGGHFTLGDALGYLRDHYDFAAGSASLVGHALTMEQGGHPVVEISSAAPGSCLITYTVTDRDGNSTTLELTYIFKERVEPPAIDPVDPERPPQGPEEEVDRDGLIHHTYQDKIVVPITDPPQFSGTLTPEKLRQIIEERYSFGPGEVSFAMTSDSLPSTVPGSCVGVYTVTDVQGNSTTLELTYEYVERYDPPVIEPADPERPLPEPEEAVDPDATVHRSYQDGITELVAYPPAFGGTLSAQEALDWMRGQYQIAPGTGTHLKESVALYQDGRDITDQGFATDRFGSCLILYRVVDEYGNSSSLAFTYNLTERQVEGGDIVSDGTDSGQSSAGNGPYTGEPGGRGHRQPADCWVHWLALALTAIALAYLLARKCQLDREEESTRENL